MTKIPNFTLDQTIALFQLTAQLSGTKWTAETFEQDKGIETSMEVLAERADAVLKSLQQYHRATLA